MFLLPGHKQVYYLANMLKSIVLLITVCSAVTAGAGSSATSPAPISADCDCASEEFVSKAVNTLFSAAVAQLQRTVRDHVKKIESIVSTSLKQTTEHCDERTQCPVKPDKNARNPSCASNDFVSNVLSTTVTNAVEQLQRTIQCEAVFIGSLVQGQNKIISCYNSGFKYYAETDSCYMLSKKMVTWLDANTTCHKNGAYLAVANSHEEMRVLGDMAAMKTDDRDARMMWAHVGAYMDSKGVWRTVTDKTLKDAGYDTWCSGYPKSDNESGQYAAVYQGALVNMPSNWSNYYICEMSL